MDTQAELNESEFVGGIREIFSSEATEGHQIEDTPFTIVRDGNRWYVMMGKYRLTDNLGSKAESAKNARQITWAKIVQVMGAMMEEYKTEKELTEVNNN